MTEPTIICTRCRAPWLGCACDYALIDSTHRMAGIDLEDLRAKGVTRASFHPNGSLASVEFGPTTSPEDETQPEQSSGPPKRRSVTGGLVPRGSESDS